MNIIDIIEKKKHNLELTKVEIDFVIDKMMSGEIDDYQISALMMAIYFNSMTDEETINLTNAMINSGDVIDLSKLENPTVDKHSTGGVGDKTSLILGPLLSTFNLSVAKMSGRGLGHTGGTLDKLEALEGFNINLSEEEFINQVNNTGLAIIGQTQELVPADKKLYALRDVTATVDSLPLIAASIMSKKIASGAHNMILDVKYGSGAFMKTKEDAEVLAEKLVMIGNGVGRNTVAVISDMEQPLGCAIGNALEVQEAIDTLKGHGPSDVTELCILLTVELLLMTETYTDPILARTKVEEKISSGEAYNKFLQFIQAQGAVEHAEETMSHSIKVVEIIAEESGYVSQVDAITLGRAAMILGAGRVKKTDIIDPAVGIVLHKKIGDFIEVGDVICDVHVNDETNLEQVISMIGNAYETSVEEVVVKKIIEKIIK
jgi:pyrimidine-nucleoside phosphorylase